MRMENWATFMKIGGFLGIDGSTFSWVKSGNTAAVPSYSC